MSDVYEFEKFLAGDGCFSLATVPSKKYAALQEANAALAARVRELEEAQGELLGLLAMDDYVRREFAPVKPDPNAKPDPDCANCDGSGCMGCVFREWGHECANDCPHCCPWVPA